MANSDTIDAATRQRMAGIAAKLRQAQTPKIDTASGAPANVRALVGAAQKPEDKLATLKKFYPDAQRDPVDPENFIFTNPETNVMTTYNPSGADVGDAPSLTREVVGQLGGAAAGAAYGGSRAGAPGAIAGGMLGALGGDEAVTLAGRAFGMEDTRTPGEHLQDSATLALTEAGGQVAGGLIQKGLAAGGKAIFRGGEAGRVGVQSAIDDAARFGHSPSVAQATQKAYLDTIEQTLSRIPGGAGQIRTAVKTTTDRVQKAMDEKVKNLTGLSDVDPEKAGRTIIQGIGDTGTKAAPGSGFLGRFAATKNALYKQADNLIPGGSLVTPSQTRTVLADLTDKVPNMPELNQYLTSSGIQGVAGVFPAKGPVAYDAMRQLRTAIGEKLTSFDLVSDISRADLKRLYGALSEDLASASSAAGPKAQAAMKRADSYYKAGISRIDNVLEPLIKNRVPEMVMAAVDRSVQKGGSTIRPIMRSLNEDERRIVAGSIIKRLGTSRPSQQGALGEGFSFETFLTNWNKLDPRAKDAMFGWPELKGMKNDMDALARWTDRMRESSKAFANPSGTAGATAGTAAGWIGTGMTAAGVLTGDARMLAFPAFMALGALGANQAAKLMTNRNFVRWLATSTKVKPNGWGAHIGRLGAVTGNADPAMEEAIMQFMTAMDQGSGNGN